MNPPKPLLFKILEDTNTDDAIADLVDQPVDRSVGTDEISDVKIDTTVPATPTIEFHGVSYASGDTVPYQKISKSHGNVSSLKVMLRL